MCESKVYFKQNDELEFLMDDVVNVIPKEGEVVLTDILGKTKDVKGRIVQVDLLDHKVVLEKS